VPQLHTSFRGRLGRSSGVLRLIQVENLASAAEEAAGRPRFSLLFDGGAARFSQGTYAMQHAVLGTFDLFLVPVGQQRGLYQAVINRSHP